VLPDHPRRLRAIARARGRLTGYGTGEGRCNQRVNGLGHVLLIGQTPMAGKERTNGLRLLPHGRALQPNYRFANIICSYYQERLSALAGL
jgi:hypothetical protein